MSVPSLHPVLAPTPPPLPPVNQLCLTKLTAIWWSWYLCYYDLFQTASESCPVQDERVPVKTTFLFHDNQFQDCSSFKPNERYCTIPAENWIFMPAASRAYLTDFVSPGNTIDTPEDSLTIVTTLFDTTYKNVMATVVQQAGNTTKTTPYSPPPPFQTLDLCNLETVDIKGCTNAGAYGVTNGWSIFSAGNWLRIPPLGKGNHTIEVKFEGFDSPPDCGGMIYYITAV